MSIKNTVGWPLKFSRKSLKTINAHVTAFRTYLNNRVTKNIPKQPNETDISNIQTTSMNEAIDIRELEYKKAPINWIPAAILIATPIAAVIITPWYLMTHQVSAPVWGVFGAFMVWTGMSITAGYHRLLSHRAYKAHPIVRNFLLLGATFAVQGSAFDWASSHRDHHRYVDDPFGDPYSVKRGFFFSHMGWMLRNYPSRKMDFKNIPDLTKDKILQIQHKYYGLWVLVTNVGLVAALGWLLGDVWGSLVIVGLLRLVLTHHFTFFINSFCHMFGSRPYTDTNSGRDNFFLAIFTWGEGYHNYHHFFQYDYRNGVKWWQYDPTKWLIAGLSKVGLTTELRTVDDTTIKHAEVRMQFKQAQQKINTAMSAGLDISHTMKIFQDRINFEHDAFMQTVAEWQALKAQKIEMKKNQYSERLHEIDDKFKQEYTRIEEKILEHNSNLKMIFRPIG
ncbi:acyl-CoA desaturase [Psychrobacter aquimaris]|jgi:stearoyl-CoA desaturase (delta-9 desaturase)|nr:acyl-CoA desaturase [Psychrobacter sp. WB2]WGV12384.1 acyl-CoA desaturase [Psychrobacter sp. WB2]